MMSAKSQVVAVVAFYMVAALVMVFVNKAVLNDTPDLTVLFMLNQIIATVALLHLTATLNSSVQRPQFELETVKKLVPLLVVDASGLVFNAYCLRGVETAFFQIARGMTLPFTIFVQSLASRSRPAASVMGCAAIVTLGFIMGVAPREALGAAHTPAPLALASGFLSSMIIAVHAVLVKQSLPLVGNSAIGLAFYTQSGSAILLSATVLINGELFHFVDLIYSTSWDFRVFLWGSCVTGIFGFLIAVAAILSVKVTSPVTHMFSSAARTVIQTLLGVWLFSDILTVGRAVSLMTIMGGTLLYTWVKSRTPPSPAPTSSPAKDVEAALFDAEKDSLEMEERKDRERS